MWEPDVSLHNLGAANTQNALGEGGRGALIRSALLIAIIIY